MTRSQQSSSSVSPRSPLQSIAGGWGQFAHRSSAKDHQHDCHSHFVRLRWLVLSQTVVTLPITSSQGAVQLGLEADTARRWPGGRAA